MSGGKVELVSKAEETKSVWHLMVQDFHWSEDALKRIGISLRAPSGLPLKKVKLQPFEVIIAAVFARVRPDYDWWVTPNRPDNGIDFVGRGQFLSSSELGIDAAITIGGQCKKRERVHDLVSELSGGLARMSLALDPTFFVAAFSAPLTPKRISNARTILERSHQRHCHILDRGQVELLIGRNLDAAEPIISKAFSRRDAKFVLDYFRKQPGPQPHVSVAIEAPTAVLAGEPFQIRIRLQLNTLSEEHWNLGWIPAEQHQAFGSLIAPIGVDSHDGLIVDFEASNGDDPFVAVLILEFVCYGVGMQDVGTVWVRPSAEGSESPSAHTIPRIQIIENLRPPFYRAPYREAFDQLERSLAQAKTGKVTSVAITGAGGAGKTRLSEEMGLEARRAGLHVVSARQAHSSESPRRILANLFLGLSDSGISPHAPIQRVDEILRRLEPKLAERARPALEALFGDGGLLGSFEDDQALLSALVVMIAERSRSQTLIIHLHDLHWCTFDVLNLFDRLLWQLGQLQVKIDKGARSSGVRALFLLEGRTHEHRESSDTGWSTRVFERFVERLDCPVAHCRAFTPDESAAFAQRLFEQKYTAQRIVPQGLLELQQGLIDAIQRVAGANPFHMLEQVKLLQQHGVLGQNPKTGFIYMVRPHFKHIELPKTVFETIGARWRYFLLNDRPLAVLLWAVGLVDDNLPSSLFDQLWSKLASNASRTDIDSTEFLMFPQSDESGSRVSYRHENYFQAIRRFQITSDERQAVIEAYGDWFQRNPRIGPALRYVHARVLLEAPKPSRQRIQKLLRAALVDAEASHDRSLAARILVTLLDEVIWVGRSSEPLGEGALLEACDLEIHLANYLVRSGSTTDVDERIRHLVSTIDAKTASFRGPTESRYALLQRKFRLLAIRAGVLFHDRRPAEAVELTSKAVEDLNSLLETLSAEQRKAWDTVAIDVYEAHSAALAFAGDLPRAVTEARRAAEIAEATLGHFPDSVNVVVTYANILLCQAPKDSQSILERYAAMSLPIREETRLRLNLNLGMARIVNAYQQNLTGRSTSVRLLNQAHDSLDAVFKQAHPLGKLADASAAALLLGLVSVLRRTAGDIDCFSQSVALAIRVRQLETLWRAHINLAHSLYRCGHSPHDSAAAALELMMFSLDSYASPDRTSRFNLLSVPMAHAVRYLILTGDDRAGQSLRTYPALRKMFSDVHTGQLRDDRAGRTSHEWLRVEDVDYVIF